ncbi:MAG: T9SS type A sorting domain-containing protein [Bacteroidales bacterium]|nr:T9SS type A sorting domain-containing protein [Bacteroidales bacterium]
MKRSVLFLAIIFCAGFSFAQVLKINQLESHTPVKEIQRGDVIELSTEDKFVQFDSEVINTSNQQQNVSLKMEVLNHTAEVDISGCWGMCLSPWNFDFEPVVIDGQGHEIFNVDYYNSDETPNSFAWVTCTFYVDGVEDFVFHVKFGEAPVSVKEPMITKNNAYPNPATSVVNIDYALNKGNAQITLYNILGVSVYEQPLNGREGTARVNIAGFAPGIYFYSIKIDGKVVETKKLVIN